MARPSKRTTSKKGKKTNRQSIREKARKAAGQRERGGGLDTLKNLPQDIEFYKPKMGKAKKGINQFSIVPYIVTVENHPFQEVGEPWHECTYWQHKIGAGSDSKRFVCPAKTAISEDKRCPICEERASLLKTGRDDELAEELKPKQRQIFNVLDHAEEDKGIQLLEISPHMFGFMLDDEDKAQEEDFEGKYYGDWEDGLMIKARFDKGTYGNPECVRVDFEERDDLPEEMVMEETVDLDASLKILSYDDIYKGFYELGMESDNDDEEGEEEEDPPKSSKRSRKSSSSGAKGKRSKKAKEEPEEEPEDEEEEEPEEPEEEEEGDCPYGHEFGYDCDQTDDCDECESWEECRDLADEIEEEERSKKKKK